MLQIAPGVTFEATTKAFAHSATVGVRIRDNQGADFLARTVTGVTEDVTVGTAAVFRKTFTAPTDSGQYTIVWDNGTILDTEELVVTASAPAQATGSLYVTRDELKVALTLAGQSYADEDIDRAVAAASRAIDNNTGRFFYTDTQVRYFTPDCRAVHLITGDIQSVSEFAVDTTGDGSFATVWTEGTDYILEPLNASAAGEPYTSVVINRRSGRRWPTTQRSIRITGEYGWAAVPNDVNQYAIILANKLLLTTRQAPFGVLSFGLDQPIATRISRVDPNFELMLGHYVQTRPIR